MRRPVAAIAVAILLCCVATTAVQAGGNTVTVAAARNTELLVDHKDLQDERREWFYQQRSYPFDTIPVDAYASAAVNYVSQRARQRSLAARQHATDARSLPTAQWLEVGPAPMLNTIFGYGNVTGRISTLALHPSNPNIVLAGGSAGGIWRTENALATPPVWLPVGDDLPTLAIADIEFAPSDPTVVYAASGDDDVNLWGMGVFKSTDGGVTWNRIDNGTTTSGIPNGTVLSKIVVHFADPNRVVAVGRSDYTSAGNNNSTSVFVTADGGRTWSRGALPGGGTSRFRSLVAESGCPEQLWAVDYPNRAILRSVDFGLNWLNIPAVGLPVFTSNTKLAVHRPSCTAAGTVYASVYSAASLAGDPARYAGVYVSVDDGATWVIPGPAAGPSGGCLGQCGYDHEIVADPLDPNRVYLIGRDFWGSTDAGATWTGISVGFPNTGGYNGGRMHVDMHAVEVWGTGPTATVWVGSDGGVWSYAVGTDTFTNRVGNLATAEIVDLALHPDTPNLAIAGLQDNGTIMYDGRLQWPAVLHGDGGYSGFLRNTSGATNPFDGAFTTYVYSTAYHSTNRGQNWTSFTSATTFNNENNEFYAPWVGTDNRLWHGAESLWFCDWPTQCDPFTALGPNLANMTGSSYISKLSIHMSAPGVYGPFYAATANTRGFLQSDDGIAWRVRTGALPNRYITQVIHNPNQPTDVWVTLSGFGTPHVWFSADGGQTWQDRTGNLPNLPVNAIYLDSDNRATNWIVGTDIGVYGTEDGGTTWNVVGTNLPAVLVSDLELGPDGKIYAATGGRSVWAIPCTAPPGAVNAVPAGDNQITVTWSGPASTYQIERAVGGCSGTFAPHATVSAPPFSYTDTTVSGGALYGYRVNLVASCGVVFSSCVETITTGPCSLQPVFSGASNAAGGFSDCALRVEWPAASGLCSGGVVYNVYKSTDPAFTPGPSNRVASCLTSLFYLDAAVVSAQAYSYVVRAESPTAVANGGPCGGAEETNGVRVTGVAEILYKTDFESALAGWTMPLGVPAASTGGFVLGDPDGTTSAGNPAQPEDDHTLGGVNCLFTAPNPGGLGADDVDDGEVVALSPSFDASVAASVHLSLWRWHFIRDLGEDDYFVLEVSNDDGAAWTTVDMLGPNQSAASWVEVAVDLETLLPLTSTMRLRVRSGDGLAATNIVETAIDDVTLTSNQTCRACAVLLPVGNTLLGVRQSDDVALTWVDAQPRLDAWRLYRSTDKTSTGASIGTPLSATYTDPNAVSSLPTLFLYKAVAVCGGSEGPF